MMNANSLFVLIHRFTVKKIELAGSLLFLLFFASGSFGEEKKTYLVFRFDDYSSISSTETELQILDIFRRNKSRVTFGTIPKVSTAGHPGHEVEEELELSASKAKILLAASEEGVVEIALHGYNHKSLGKDQGEFIDVEYQTQLLHLTQGKQILETLTGKKISTFIPPWNKYDQNTLNALNHLHFETLSAGITKPRNLNHHDLTLIPFTCHLRDLKKTLPLVKHNSDSNQLIVVLFHEFDFIEIDQVKGHMTIAEFGELVDQLAANQSIAIISLEQAAKQKQMLQLSADRFKQNESIVLAQAMLPTLLRSQQDGTYAVSSLTIWAQVSAYYFGLFIALISLGFLVGKIIHGKYSANGIIKIAGILFVLALALLVAILLLDQLNAKALTLLCSLFGIGVGIFSSSAVKKVTVSSPVLEA